MPQLLVGRTGFEDAGFPVPGKNDWGVDTLSRKMTGHVSYLDDFIASLAQGQVYQFNGALFFLQTWEPDQRTPVSTVTLVYKGLIRGTPAPSIETEVASVVGTTNKDYSLQNDGKGLLYDNEVYASASSSDAGTPGSFGTSIYFTRNRWTTGATMEFTYRAPTTTYRYISVGPPAAPSYTQVFGSFEPQIERVRILTSDGKTFGASRMASFGLAPVALTRVIGFSSKPIYGTPWYECVDVVRTELVAPAVI